MEIAITKGKQELERLEGVIRNGQRIFYEVGRALMEIRDRELYKLKNGGKYGTFEGYCKGEWDFNSSRARQLMGAVQVFDNIESVTTVTPTAERQTRPLARLEPEKQREVWQKAVETAPEGKVTADHVYKIAKQETQEAEKEVVTSQARVAQTATEAMQFVVIAISQLGRIRKDDPKRVEALNRVKTWINDQLKER